MLYDLRKARLGWTLWKKLMKQYHIDYQTVVLLLPEKDTEWNDCALKYLPDYMERKSASSAVVLVPEKGLGKIVESRNIPGCKPYFFPRYKMGLLLKYYCLYRFFDNIVFLYLDQPRDNLSRLILEQGTVNVEEMICLGFYNLRRVPHHV